MGVIRTNRARFVAALSFIVAAGAGLAGPGAAEAALIAYWNFDDNIGSLASDFSANANTGTLGGSSFPTWVTNGGNTGNIGDHALNFGGTTSFVSVAPSGSLGAVTTQFTVAAWLLETANSNYGHIMVTTSNFSNREWLWQTENSSGGDQAYVWSSTVAAWQKPLGFTTPNNVWRHVTLTYDGALASNQLKSYINGSLQGQYTVTGSPAFPIFAGGALYLGGWLAGNSGFLGRLDDMVIFNSVEDPVAIRDGTHAEMNPPVVPAVPEPASAALLAFGLLALTRRR